MGRLIYSAIQSLDGYIADAAGNFDWSAPDEEVHSFVNAQSRPIGTYLFGRRMYEVLSVWETMPTEGEPGPMQEYARLWRTADKVVYSTTLDSVPTSRTRLEREFDAADVTRLKTTSERDISVGGAGIAAHALRAGLVDELQLYLVPAIVGGGTAFLPDDIRLSLTLLDERRFTAGTVFLRYAITG